jgi:hypothetical protein
MEERAVTEKIEDKLLSPDASKFDNPDPEYTRFEVAWWATLLSTKKFRVRTNNVHARYWDSICGLAFTTEDVPHKIAIQVENLGRHRVNPTAYQGLVATLKVMLAVAYSTMEKNLIIQAKRDATLVILPILLEDGLLSPAATLWLALNNSSEPPTSALTIKLVAYGLHRRSTWSAHNKALQSWKSSSPRRTAKSAPNMDVIELSSDNESATSSEG